MGALREMQIMEKYIKGYLTNYYKSNQLDSKYAKERAQRKFVKKVMFLKQEKETRGWPLDPRNQN